MQFPVVSKNRSVLIDSRDSWLIGCVCQWEVDSPAPPPDLHCTDSASCPDVWNKKDSKEINERGISIQIQPKKIIDVFMFMITLVLISCVKLGRPQVKSSKWVRYFGFIAGYWEEVEPGRPSLITVLGFAWEQLTICLLPLRFLPEQIFCILPQLLLKHRSQICIWLISGKHFLQEKPGGISRTVINPVKPGLWYFRLL